MSNPYQATSTTLLSARGRPVFASVAIFFAFALTGLVSFLLGCAATVFALLRVFTPPANCPSPCDAPAYVALGVAVFVAPVVGMLSAGGGIYALSRLLRRRPGAAA